MKRHTHSSVLTASAVTLGLLLTGCGGAEDQPEEAEADTRTVVDATGTEVEVPADPQKVVTLHYAATQPMYDLGLMPVGQGDVNEEIVPEDVWPELSNVPVVTDLGEPQLEEIALLEPDLILAPNTTEDDVLEHLRNTAPVYIFTLRGGDRANWQHRTVEVADAINKSDGVDELQAAFEARQEEIATTYADQIADTKVAVVGSFEENNMYVWGEANMTGTILLPLGFTWSEQANTIVATEDEAEVTVSFEKIGTAISAFPGGKNTIAGYSDANYLLDMVEEALAAQG
ncbi:ABC transporter substrate-binding protein [Ornithinimicrobium sp. F0845]|uniref:ABC transporter substrate-binding protein n=1 Tax=Ornithinimicrobium sp. F0845 TaxID=2926412 RepID=UPI001FF23B07|nr:ABC transporter substrate-binding protein [Ornithinimicrobium sp. F0845]MCK0112450.1 ABC transporter substrate-binding protein [Ornithinimicrobium sp. F0845]